MTNNTMNHEIVSNGAASGIVTQAMTRAHAPSNNRWVAAAKAVVSIMLLGPLSQEVQIIIEGA
ncbi:hypothetical protein [Paenibacillus sp. 481]|uniref:hypothetical protein n=1 Tax=Paenibacillus sp. 481 TaxID=2835869 RepID=UPI001E4254EA|nr:hypothetical protein [Paenibacillus sp. 481]UHA74614.1 hypothetical protein KIK04_05865 [Paenibacillus sp. 481]